MAMHRDTVFRLPGDAVDELNCVVCLERKSLLLFPCQHRCCKECTDHIRGHSSSLSCPLCRARVDIPQGGLPVCRLTEALRNQLQIVEAANSSNSNLAPTRDKCQICTNEMDMRCKKCAKFLCCRCSLKTACDPSKPADRHDLENLEEVRKRTDTQLQTWIQTAEQEIGDIDSEIKKLETQRQQKRVRVSSVKAVLSSDSGVKGRLEIAEQLGNTDSVNSKPVQQSTYQKVNWFVDRDGIRRGVTETGSTGTANQFVDRDGIRRGVTETGGTGAANQSEHWSLQPPGAVYNDLLNSFFGTSGFPTFGMGDIPHNHGNQPPASLQQFDSGRSLSNQFEHPQRRSLHYPF